MPALRAASALDYAAAVMKTYLIIDTPYICHRTFHSIPNLSHGGVATAVVFGVLRDVAGWCDLFQTCRVVWTFDRGRSLRTRAYPAYKRKRYAAVLTAEERKAKEALRKQMHLLRTDYLPALGYRNVFAQPGFEADDIIASVCNTITEQKHEAIIIGADKDLYQCLGRRVCMFNPRTRQTITEASFTAEYGIEPLRWIEVKSLAGCRTDNVEGIQGVGEKTALAFLAGRLKEQTKAFQAIVKGNDIWRRNIGLVGLPFPGTRRFTLREDELTDAKWRGLARRLGLRSLLGRAPIDIRKKGVRR